MEGQLNLNLISGEEIILADEVENAEKLAKEYQKAINRAQSLINDAKKRYIKEKTRARSKKAAEEREAVLKSSRFKDIEIYDRREDILDAYGWGIISMEECDRLEALWDEREEIRNQFNGINFYGILKECPQKINSTKAASLYKNIDYELQAYQVMLLHRKVLYHIPI